MNEKKISEVMKEVGRRGGKKGGKSRMESMTPEERTVLAKKAAARSAEVRAAKKAQKEAENT